MPSNRAIGKQADVIIDIGLRVQNIKGHLDKAKKQLMAEKAKMQTALNKEKLDFFGKKQAIQKRVQGYRNQITQIMRKANKRAEATGKRRYFTNKESEQLNRLKANMHSANTTLAKHRSNFEKTSGNIKKRFTPAIEKAQKKVNGYNESFKHQSALQDQGKTKFARMNNAVKQQSVRFDGAAMSMMFFGMALQRVFMGIWKSSQETFQKVMGSVEGTTTEFTKLQGSMTFLKFVAGQALEPLATALIPIIENMAKFVEKNPEFLRKLVKWGIILGTIVMVYGMLKLAAGGFYEFGLTKTARLSDAFGYLKKKMGRVSSSKLFNKKALMTPKGIGAMGVIAAFVILLFWLNKIKNQFGSWPEFFKSVGRGLIRTAGVIVSNIGAGFGWLFEKVMGGWNWLVEQTNKLRAKIGKEPLQWKVETTGLSFSQMRGDMMHEFENMATGVFGKPEKGWAKSMSFMDFVKGEIDFAETKPKKPVEGEKKVEMTNHVTVETPAGMNEEQANVFADLIGEKLMDKYNEVSA